ncbi:MAG: hypothetical protein HQM10_07405 [Candidatus Riflebacteria bacterium]|nr:hypothetical protein [Candidatus Riflebacteria bacterium]
MKVRSLLGIVLLVSFIAGGAAWAFHDYRDLQMANSMRDRGDFYGARGLYYRIATDYSTSDSIRREAGYFVGFCNVRLNDHWAAIKDFNWFLKNFDNGNPAFIADAIFVLGRTFEVVNDYIAAKRCYYDCARRFPYSEFSAKSKDRLRMMGEYINFSVSSMNMADSNGEAAVEGSADSTQKVQIGAASKNDPFAGFEIDQAKVNRVNKFLMSVEKMENVDAAVRELAPEDGRLEVVKKGLSSLKEKNKFNNLHDAK